MQFKELKVGFPVFLLDRMTVDVKQGKVSAIGLPHLETKPGSLNEMLVDVSIECGGQTMTYAFKDTANIGYTHNLAISPDRDAIMRELEAISVQTEQYFSQQEAMKVRRDKIDKVMADFNPALREKQEAEERFCKIERSICDVKTQCANVEGSMDEIKSMLQRMLASKKNGKDVI